MFLLLVLLCAFITYLIITAFKKRSLINTLPPGPIPVPVFGNILQIDRKDPRKTFLKWSQIYGPVYTVWIAAEPYIYHCTYESMQETFVKHGDQCLDRPKNWMFDYVLKGNNGIVMASGEQWKEQRRFSLHTLRNFGFGRKLMEEKVTNEATKLLTAIDEHLAVSKDSVINLSNDLHSCTCNIISSVLMGRSYTATDPEFLEIKSSLDRLFKFLISLKGFLLFSFGWLRYIPLFNHCGFDEYDATSQVVIQFIIEEVERHKKEMNFLEEPDDFISAYLQEVKKRSEGNEPPSAFSEWQLVCILFDLWIAGMETTVTTMRWAFLLMIKYPEIQQKVQNEIDAIIGPKRLPSMTDKNQMPYTQAVLNEIQRFANILSANFPRMVAEGGITIAGYSVPGGIGVVPQISVANMDDKIFSNPNKFDPNHFLESDGISLKKIEAFVPFSIGKRMCLGEGLARMEMFLIFTSVLQRFRLSLPSNQPEPSLTPVIRFTLDAQPYDCFVEKRN